MNLSKPQQLIYDMEKYAGGAIAVICGSVLFDGEKDAAALQQAANELYRLNDALRFQITKASGTVTQELLPYAEREIPVLRFPDKAALDAYAETEAKTPMDLHGNLCELRVVLLPGQYGILGKLHHLVSDAWTLALLGSQFHSLVNGEAPQAYSYTDYLETEPSYFGSARAEKDRAFFLEQFKRCEEVTYLSDRHSDAYAAGRKRFTIEQADAKVILDYCSAKGVSVFSLFAAVLATYINRIKMNAEQFYIGTAVLNRTGLKEKNTAGMFINTVPVLIELKNTSGFAENLDAVDRSILSVLRHQKYHYGELLSALRKEYGFREKLYDVILSYQNACISGGGETSWYANGCQTENLAIHIDDREQKGILQFCYEYKTSIFSEKDIDFMHRRLCSLLFDAVQHDEKKLYKLRFLEEQEKQTLRFAFNQTQANYPKEKCVHQLFEAQAARTPELTAMVFEGRAFSYRQLDEMSNALAHFLISAGVSIGDPVPIAARRSEYIFVAMLAVLKAGGAYVPLDYQSPAARIRSIAQELNAKVVLVYDKEIVGIETVRLDLFDYSSRITRVNRNVRPEDPCYIIYTSGSTGTPKGVVIRHRNVVNYCYNNKTNRMLRRLFDECHCSSVVSINNICFDAFLDESFLPMLNGMTVYFASQEQTENPSEFLRLIHDNPIELVSSTPTKLKLLTSGKPCACKHIILGGEILTQEDVSYFSGISSASIYNTYGPTETTCGTTYTQIMNPSGSRADITIGKPIANTQIYIVDRFMQLVPIGVIGELCIAGDGVGAGYFNRPELTAAKFIDNPFGEGKLFKTGDLACWREDGNIAYVGRNDFQVKIRGLRIELGEIESALTALDGISQSAVIVRVNREGRQLICAFYTGSVLENKKIRAELGKTLPKYMIPHIITHLDCFPLTPSGKINRNALPEVDLHGERTEYCAPKTELQELLCAAFSVSLGIGQIGITDDFFDSGGDSLKAIELLCRLQDDGFSFHLQDIFECPTVEMLSAKLEAAHETRQVFSREQFEKYGPLLSGNRESSPVPAAQTPGAVFLTGATGYLGAHILDGLLTAGAEKVYCLVRRDAAHLWDGIRYYFGGKYIGDSRIVPLVGNLETACALEFSGKIDLVVHAAATVKHYGNFADFDRVNVAGTQHVIELTKRLRAKMLHISTIGVSGADLLEKASARSETEKDFSEADLYIGQKLENAYTRSKFLAECAVLDAALEGLPVSIIRVGNLTNRRRDGLFQPNYETNAFLTRLKAILELGCFPDYLMDLYAEFSPVDETAAAIVRIAEHFTPQRTVYHVYNHRHLYFRDLLPMLRELGCPLEIVSAEAFAERLRSFADPSVRQALANDLDENGKWALDSNVRVHCDSTARQLEQLGFRWQPVDFAYLKQYIDYFTKIGYLS